MHTHTYQQPSVEDGAMKMISTMYKCTKDSSQFEEKTYKVPPTTST